MRILAIDHGTKRMGIAMSDELGVIAQPLEFILAEPFAEFLSRLREIIRDQQVELILVGMPLLWPYAWVAFLAMCTSIGAALLARRAWGRPR